jgi:hypothetical protein
LRYFASPTISGPNPPESEFPFIFVNSAIKSLLPTAIQSLHPQALKVFEIEKSSIHSSSL